MRDILDPLVVYDSYETLTQLMQRFIKQQAGVPDRQPVVSWEKVYANGVKKIKQQQQTFDEMDVPEDPVRKYNHQYFGQQIALEKKLAYDLQFWLFKDLFLQQEALIPICQSLPDITLSYLDANLENQKGFGSTPIFGKDSVSKEIAKVLFD